LKNIKSAANNYEETPDIDAFIVLNFYYKSLIQVYNLDNNTLTISSVRSDLEKLEERMDSLGINISEYEFKRPLLVQYR